MAQQRHDFHVSAVRGDEAAVAVWQKWRESTALVATYPLAD